MRRRPGAIVRNGRLINPEADDVAATIDPPPGEEEPLDAPTPAPSSRRSPPNIALQAFEHYDRAIDLAANAAASLAQGETTRAERLYCQGFSEAAAAAELVAELRTLEPTRSIFHRDAAALAQTIAGMPTIAAGDHAAHWIQSTYEMATRGLNGSPPPDVAADLFELQLGRFVPPPIPTEAQ